jgi:hypothetical protein
MASIVEKLIDLIKKLWGIRNSELPGGGNLDEFKGRLPYDAQYVGTFQPLLGWRGKTTKAWINRQVAHSFDSLLTLIEKDRQLVKGPVFDGGLDDPPP